jgi:hypothetical protein
MVCRSGRSAALYRHSSVMAKTVYTKSQAAVYWMGRLACMTAVMVLGVSCHRQPVVVRIPIGSNIVWHIRETNYYVRNADYLVFDDRRAMLQIMAAVDWIPGESDRTLALQFAQHAVTSSSLTLLKDARVNEAPTIFEGADVALVQNPRLVSNAVCRARRYRIEAAELAQGGDASR